MRVSIAALLYLILFVMVELLTKRCSYSKEISRKIVHVVAGSIAAMLPAWMSFTEIAVLSLVFIPVMLISKKVNIFSSIHAITRPTYGEVYFPVAILITAWAFPNQVFYMYGLLVMAISDGFASIVGQKYGKARHTFFTAKKSLVGSMTFFTTSLLIGCVIICAFTDLSLIAGLISSLLLAVILTICEASLSRGLDNLILPPLAALLLSTALRLFN